MSNDIVLSAGIRQNLLSLQTTSGLQERTQTRLATGKKVNSALDNAVNFFDFVLSNVADNQIVRAAAIEGKSIRVTEAVCVNLRNLTGGPSGSE